MHTFPFSSAARIEMRTERPGYRRLASMAPETRCPEVYKRGKERIPYPLLELADPVDSILLYKSSGYGMQAVSCPAAFITAVPGAVRPQAALPVAVIV
jgi:hypothetical protein